LLHGVVISATTSATLLCDIFAGLLLPIGGYITGYTLATPAVFTTAVAHGLTIGDRVFLSGTDGDITPRSGVVDAASFTSTTFVLTG